jgi:transposase
MPTGLTSAWGYSIPALGGFNKGLSPSLTYQQSLVSTPVTFKNGVLESPLTNFAFGYKPRQRRGVKRFSKKMCKKFLKKKGRNPLTGRKIKRNGKVYKKLMRDCKFHKLIRSKKKTSKKKL